jgi:prophage tail gpP-like protein
MVSFRQFEGPNNNIQIDINGKRFAGFTSASVQRSMDSLFGTFQFSTTVKEDADAIIDSNLKMEDEVTIFIDNQLVMTGYIDDFTNRSDVGSHYMAFSGKDITADIAISSMPMFDQLNFKNFKTMVEKVLLKAEIDVKVITDLSAKDLDTLNFDAFNNEGKAPDLDMTIFDFFDHFAKQKQVLLLTNEKGELVITREESKISPGVLTCKKKNNSNNILASNVSINTQERFSKVFISAQDVNAISKEQLNQESFSVDSQIRKSKQRRVFYPNKTTDPNALKNMSQWYVNIYKSAGSVYSVATQGYYAQAVSEILWQINTLVDVEDEATRVKGQYLIEGFSFSKDVEQGSVTQLRIVDKGSYTIKSEKEVKITGGGKQMLEELFN